MSLANMDNCGNWLKGDTVIFVSCLGAQDQAKDSEHAERYSSVCASFDPESNTATFKDTAGFSFLEGPTQHKAAEF